MKDVKDVEDRKKKTEQRESEAGAGWGVLGSKLDSQNKASGAAGGATSSTNQPTSARANGPSDGTINFKRGPPVFQKRNKGIMDTQNFPDMADAASGAKNTNNNDSGSGAAASNPKINNVNMFSGVYADRSARNEQRPGGEERKAGATKPVFTGKGKFKTGGAANEEPANPSMNYDFSKMRMSAAKSGGGNRTGEAGDGENRGDGERRRGGPKQMQGSNSRTFGGDDDDFEVVTDKKKGAGFRRGNF